MKRLICKLFKHRWETWGYRNSTKSWEHTCLRCRSKEITLKDPCSDKSGCVWILDPEPCSSEYYNCSVWGEA